MKRRHKIAVWIAIQAALVTQVLSQGDLKGASEPPISVSLQKSVSLGVNYLQIAVHNNSHSQLTLDKERLEAPGCSLTRPLDSSDGTVRELCWGIASGVFGGPDATAISHDVKRAVRILPGAELKMRLAPAKILTRMPPEFQGTTVRIRLEFRGLIVAVDNKPPASSEYGAVFNSNTIELPIGKP